MSRSVGDEIVYQNRGVDHRCLPPSARSRISFGAISASTRRADSATAAWFLGENTAHGSIFWLIHAFSRSLRVELLAFALFSRHRAHLKVAQHVAGHHQVATVALCRVSSSGSHTAW